jgi:hypothetical protein
VLGKFVYWLAVLVVSVALVIALILWFESRDESRVEGSVSAVAALSVR